MEAVDCERIRKSAFKKVLEETYKQYYREMLEKNPDMFYELSPVDFREKHEQLLSWQATKYKSTHVWITINPYEDIEIDKFQRTVNKVLQKKWLKDYILTYEQRGDSLETIGEGPHCHMLILRDGKRPSEIRKEIYNTCKNICSDMNKVHIQFIKDENHLENIRNYLKGNKVDEHKRQKVEIDKRWRSAYCIADYYSDRLGSLC